MRRLALQVVTVFDETVVDKVSRWVRRVRTSGLGPGGTVVSSMAASMRRAMLLALSAWHVVMACVVLAADPRLPVGPLVAVHLALAVLALASARRALPLEVCLVLGYAAWAVDYLAARSVDDVVTLAACWLGNLLYLASAIALRTRARTWIPLVGPVLVVAVIVAVSPVWQLQKASAFVVTAVAIVVAARMAMPALWGLAEDADANVGHLEAERRADEVVRRASAEAAEVSRLVHDTVINTLGAVANGAGARGAADVVRERCRRDLVVIEGLLRGRRGASRRRLSGIGEGGPVEVRRTGLTAEDLDELQDVLAPEVVDALVGAAEEAVRNAGKHAGVETVTVDVARHGAHLVATVTDRGTGFDVDHAQGHGIRESLRGRVEQVHGQVDIDSRPGHGTVVRISCPIGRAGSSGADQGSVTTVAHVAVVAARLVRRATWLMCLAVVGVGVVIELANRPGQLTWTYAVHVLVAGCVVAAYLAVRRTGDLPGAIATLLVLALPVGFVGTLAAIDFGRTEVFTFQAIATFPLLAILVASGQARTAAVAGGMLAATAIVVAVLVQTDVREHAAIVLVGAAPVLGLGLAWWGFQRLVLRVVTESEAARAETAAAGLELAARREIAGARRRWGTATLERSAALLRGIGDGRLDPGVSEVREACAAEEEHLRQLLLLNPAAYRVSAWFAHALAAARSRDVRLVIRTGDRDAPDETAAGAIGGLVMQAVAGSPSGGDLSVGWFPTAAGQRLILVGRNVDDEPVAGLPRTWQVSRTDLEDCTMVEVVVA